MSGPIVRTGTTPKFWQNYDRIFRKGASKKADSAKKETAAKAAKSAKKKTAKKATGKKKKK